MPKEMEKIKLARANVRAAENRLMKVMTEVLLPGTLVEYDMGDNTVYCQVTELGVGGGTRVNVQSESGKRYWIDVPRIRLRGTNV